MITNSNNLDQSENTKDLINPEFSDLFKLSTEDAQIHHEARMIMFRFLGEIERITNQERGLKRRLSDAIGKSKSFITQLFNGDKIINLLTLAKFQKALGIKFKIIACTEADFAYCHSDPLVLKNIFIFHFHLPGNTTESTGGTVEHVQNIHKSEAHYS